MTSRYGRIREPVERDQVLDHLDEREDPDELVLLDDDVDLGLAGGARLERQVVEGDPDERLVADQVELEVADLREHLDAHLALAVGAAVDREHEAVVLDLEDRSGRRPATTSLSGRHSKRKRACTLDGSKPFRKR